MCLPQTAQVSMKQLLDANSSTETVALQHHQQQQLKLPVSRGGFGITSLSHISHAAYVARSGTQMLKPTAAMNDMCSLVSTAAHNVY
jgi:hypothetical protein